MGKDRPDYWGSVVVTGSVEITNPVVNVQGTVTVSGDVRIIGGTVNIQTANADNIVIDLLKEDAWQERRATASNDAGGTPTLKELASYRGKGFSRGMRGYLDKISLCVKNEHKAPYSWTETTDTDFNSGTHYQTEVIGSGAAASVRNKQIAPGVTAGITSPGSTSYPTSTFGKGVGGSTYQAGAGYVRAVKFTLSVPGTVKKVGVYISSGATGQLRVGIYKNDGSGGAPGTLVTESAAVAAANGWNDIDVTPAYLPAGTYYLAWQHSATGPYFTYDTGAIGDYYYVAWTFGAFPNPFGTGTASNSVYSLRATYVQIKGYIKGTKLVPGWTGDRDIDKVYFYAHDTGNVRLAIYDNASPKNKLWESPSFTVYAGWNSIDISSGTPTTLALTGGTTYWLCWQTDSVNDVPSYVAGAAGDGFYLAYDYGAYPSTISGETSSAEKWAMYVLTKGTYYTDGTYTSWKMDVGNPDVTYTTGIFHETYGENGDIKIQIRAATTSEGLDTTEWEGPNGPGTYWNLAGSEFQIPSKWNGKRWIQYRAMFTVIDQYHEIRLDDMTINYVVPAAAHINYYLKVNPAHGTVRSGLINVPEGCDGWVEGGGGCDWIYDSMFIYIVAQESDVYIYYDTGQPYDAWKSVDNGLTWQTEDRRYWIRPKLTFLTCGDVPVSGCINTVQVPNTVSQALETTGVTVPPGGKVYAVDIRATGRLLYALVGVSDINVGLVIEADDVEVWGQAMTFTFYSAAGLSASTPYFSLTKFVTDGISYMLVTAPIPFRRRIRIGFYNGSSSNQTGYIEQGAVEIMV
jgi:hypothetical protein